MSARPGPTRSDAEVLAKFTQAKSRPPCSDTLSLNVLSIDQAAGKVRIAMVGQAAWCNPRGALQGGFVTAMLDEAMAIAGIVAGEMAFAVPTLELKTTFLRPCPAGPVEAEGRVIKWGQKAAFLEADLFDAEGKLVARATSTVVPTPLPARHPRADG
ncbi:hypothetical protein PbB2_00194 [Candidatus Phycosocius bacilliformis]|uniref:Thioesterase domain-containing protein n=1 Tax=Candidatus Phycosocius bacilliformis TaxID=1445552 RepID=A0A2P2E663_9PROT|nr:PaaI family thioesterase [Candidatus Phycosocius bacilliformis]GBF56537.1 hypothetical protein PbB2_00194 [Candidatus Phycosocius bacilliformis]